MYSLGPHNARRGPRANTSCSSAAWPSPRCSWPSNARSSSALCSWTTANLRNIRASIWVVDPKVRAGQRSESPARHRREPRSGPSPATGYAVPLYWSIQQTKMPDGSFKSVQARPGLDDCATLVGRPGVIRAGSRLKTCASRRRSSSTTLAGGSALSEEASQTVGDRRQLRDQRHRGARRRDLQDGEILFRLSVRFLDLQPGPPVRP